MINRVKHLVDHPPESRRLDEYFIVEAYCNGYVVTFETALMIERQLEHCPALRWIEFRDVFGSRHRVLSLHVYHIGESTPQTREAMRRFEKLREKEGESDEKDSDFS
ncbi:MAG TPA: hypothetical protein VEB19_13240 [Gemmatimonadaceae bacterium]|nr:hypothetical protein [Gemmatimonadaceae bacterium]